MDIKKALIALPLLGIGLVPATGAWAHPYTQPSTTTTTSVDSSDSAHCTTPTNDDIKTGTTTDSTTVDSSSASKDDGFAGLCTDLKIEKKAGSIDWDGKTVEWEMTVTNLGPDDVPDEQAIVVTDEGLTFSNFGLKIGEHFTVTLYPHNFVAETCTQTNTASVALADMPTQKSNQEIVPAVVIDGNMKNNTSTASFDSCTEVTTTTSTTTTTTSSTTSSTPEATTAQPVVDGSTSSTTGSSAPSTTKSTSASTTSQATTTGSGASTQGTSLSGTDVKSAVNTRSSNLPFTGANSSTFVALALGLIGIGVSVLFASKRRSR